MSQPQILEMNVNHDGRSFALKFPESPDIVRHIQSILSGEEYPSVRVSNYTPRVIVDVGANIGAFALHQALLFPQAAIYCFEPGPQASKLLAQNMAPFSNVVVHPWGLWSETCHSFMFEGLANSMQNSLFSSAETSTAKSEVDLRCAKDELIRLNLNNISVLKIDTEGAELPILESLGGILPGVDQIHVEYHSEDDRRAIDAILRPNFILARSRADFPHRGTCHYLAVPFVESRRDSAPYAPLSKDLSKLS